MSEPNYAEDRPARYRAVALQTLAQLSGGDANAATLHRARTHLRRLQAYLELVGEERNAAAITRCVTRLSTLRTLQVLERYLKRHDAPRSDRKPVMRRIRAKCRKFDRTRVYAAIERIVRRRALPPAPANPEWMAERMQAARHAHADAFRQLTAAIDARPRRKTLHRIRLLIKSIRYQEEWALGHPFAMPELVQRLKHAQAVLGDYEHLVQFRKLARSLDLRSSAMIKKHWRTARKRARVLPLGLSGIIGVMAGPWIRIMDGRCEPEQAAGQSA